MQGKITKLNIFPTAALKPTVFENFFKFNNPAEIKGLELIQAWAKLLTHNCLKIEQINGAFV